MNFKFTKIKAIISIVVSILVAIYMYNFWRVKAATIPGPLAPIGESIIVAVVSLIVVFAVLYLIISLFQKK